MFAEKINLLPCFTKNKLTSALMTAMVVIIASGCSNNAADAGGSKIVNSAQAKTTVVASDSDKGVVSALQENLKASGIEEKIISAVPTDMSGVYWVTAEGLPPFFTDKSGKHIIQGQIISVGNGEPVDISSSLIAKTAKSELKNVAKKDMIIYPAKAQPKPWFTPLPMLIAAIAESFMKKSAISTLAALRFAIWRGREVSNLFQKWRRFGAARTVKKP